MKTFIIWLLLFVLSVISSLLSQLALFVPTLKLMENSPLSLNLAISIFFVLIQTALIIPMLWKGLLIMSPIQLTIFVFVITFLVQLITNKYIFENVNTIDDYFAMILMTLGIVISKLKTFG
jgi:hypothetical protein